MNDKEKFEGLKNKMLDDNEAKYGKEVREKYGDKIVEESYDRFARLSKADFERMQETAQKILTLLENAVGDGDRSCRGKRKRDSGNA